MALTEQTRADAVELAGRYPQSRSALLPLLHLVQSAEGTVTPDGIALCADVVGLTTAEVAAAIPALCAAVQELVTRWTPDLITPSPASLQETAHE